MTSNANENGAAKPPALGSLNANPYRRALAFAASLEPWEMELLLLVCLEPELSTRTIQDAFGLTPGAARKRKHDMKRKLESDVQAAVTLAALLQGQWEPHVLGWGPCQKCQGYSWVAGKKQRKARRKCLICRAGFEAPISRSIVQLGEASEARRSLEVGFGFADDGGQAEG